MVWSKWIEGGFYLNFVNLDAPPAREYHKVKRRSYGHVEWEFGYPDVANEDRVVGPLELKGPYTPTLLDSTKSNMLHQIIHGHKPDVYVYKEWPAEAKRHGLPKKVWHSADLREVAHFTMSMSPFKKPSFITEFFMLEDILESVDFQVYNPSDEIPLLPRFNFHVNKLELEKIGEVSAAGVQTPTSDMWRETLDRLHRGLLYSRPITFVFPRTTAG